MKREHILLLSGLLAVGATAALSFLFVRLRKRSKRKAIKHGKTVLLQNRDEVYTGPSFITLPPGASTLSKEILIDKIKGAIYGQAIGDAIGLSTEFMTKQECNAYYGKYEHIAYKVFHQDFHRSRWKAGDWTDDTDQMVLILESMLATGGKVEAIDFAKRLKYWVHNGYPELGDVRGLGLGATVGSVVSQIGFDSDPHACAIQVWENSLKTGASNGAVMRTSILGIPHFNELGKVVYNTQNICKTTHPDPRCLASCVFVTTAIALMLQGVPSNDELIEKAYFNGSLELVSEKDKQEYYKHTHVQRLEELSLDMQPVIGYTLKCLGGGVYCLRNGTNFKDSINQLVMEGGDSDTNGAVAGALLGCKLGYNKLPQDWLSGLLEKPWLDEKVDRFLALLGLR